jgi:hypothetical protein
VPPRTENHRYAEARPRSDAASARTTAYTKNLFQQCDLLKGRDPGARRKGRGQALVLFALLVPLILLFLLLALGLAAALDVRAHAADALGVATRAGARQVTYGPYGQGGTEFDPAEVDAHIRSVFADALALQPLGLTETPETIAQEMTIIEIGYGAPGTAWPSPFVEGRLHYRPTVAAQARVPVKLWTFELTLKVVSETEVR